MSWALPSLVGGEDYVDIDSGNVTIRLIKVLAVESKLSLRLSVPNVEEAYRKLLAGADRG